MIIKLQGGLGNQLFQYAYGRSQKEELFFDPTSLPYNNPPRRYELGAFDLPIEIVGRAFPGERTYGYWANEKYFDQELIRKDFSRFGTTRNECCFIGVRRTDYLTSEVHYVLPMDYYHEALKLIPRGVRILIFSDDPQWCRENMDGEVIETCNLNAMARMSHCRYAIIANSTFHWWGAWLGHPEKVIAPAKWLKNEDLDIVPERWIKI